MLRSFTALRPRLGVILGSGFGPVANAVRELLEVPYGTLPGFPVLTAKGHHGCAVLGMLEGTPVLVMGGRAHYYEGHSLGAVTFPVRVMAAFGVTTLVLTNAAGGINPSFRKGGFMLVRDHINLMGANPLRGPECEGLERFVDMTAAYDPGLADLFRQAARECDISLNEGVYLAVSGPNYETPAEIKAFARLGADAVGMSTVPEVLVARQCGLRVAALSCISNMAAGMGEPILTPEDVLATSGGVSQSATALISRFAKLHGKT